MPWCKSHISYLFTVIKCTVYNVISYLSKKVSFNRTWRRYNYIHGMRTIQLANDNTCGHLSRCLVYLGHCRVSFIKSWRWSFFSCVTIYTLTTRYSLFCCRTALFHHIDDVKTPILGVEHRNTVCACNFTFSRLYQF